MKPSATDIDPLPHRWRNLLPLTGLTASQIRTVTRWPINGCRQHRGDPGG